MIVSFLIVNYNTGSILKKCIDSIYRHENEINFEIIIVDNNSSDNSKEYIEQLCKRYSETKFIYFDKKESFSYANNKAFDLSNGDYILIMNPDIIFTGQILRKLVNNLEEHKVLGAVCPVLMGTDGKFQRRYFQRYPTLLQFIFFYSIFAKFFIKYPYLANRFLENHDIDIHSKKLEFVDQIPCAFLLTRRTIFETAGKMDPAYELFFEDVDLSYQILKKHKLAVDTSVSTIHLGGASFKTSDDYWLYGRFILSMIIFFRKNYNAWRTLSLKIMALINSYVILTLEMIKKPFGRSKDYRIRKHQYFLKEFKKTCI